MKVYLSLSKPRGVQGIRCLAPLIPNFVNRRNGQLHTLTGFAWQGTPVTAEEEDGWASEPIPTLSEESKSLVLTGIRTSERSSRSESLYRLRYPGSNIRISFKYTVISVLRVTINTAHHLGHILRVDKYYCRGWRNFVHSLRSLVLCIIVKEQTMFMYFT